MQSIIIERSYTKIDRDVQSRSIETTLIILASYRFTVVDKWVLPIDQHLYHEHCVYLFNNNWNIPWSITI